MSSADRILVIRNRDLVPLLPEPVQAAEQPWPGVVLERHSVKPMEIPEHEHGDLCLHLQLSGDSDFEWWTEGKNRVETTAPGSMIVLPAGTRDRLRWAGPSERLLLSLRSSEIARLAEETTGSPEVNFSPQWSATDSGLRNLLMEMGRQVQDGWPLGSLYANLLSLDLQHHLLRKYAGGGYKSPVIKGGLPRPQLRRAMEFMNERLTTDLHLDEIAEELEISPFHFARAFRGSTGQTPHQYLLDRRMDEAKALLKHSMEPVGEIAVRCGFNSPVNFTRAFRERVGCTPTEWRMQAS
jgi:AraC family transcriptional regulator